MHAARGGTEAVAPLSRDQKAFDMVLQDILMRRDDGGATFAALQRIDLGVCVVLGSGTIPNGQVTEMLGRGALDYPQNPHDLTDLQQALQRSLSGD